MKNMALLALVFLLFLGCAQNNYTAPADRYGTKAGWSQDPTCAPGCPPGAPTSW
jgi:hypothetical protein